MMLFVSRSCTLNERAGKFTKTLDHILADGLEMNLFFCSYWQTVTLKQWKKSLWKYGIKKCTFVKIMGFFLQMLECSFYEELIPIFGALFIQFNFQHKNLDVVNNLSVDM